MLKLIITHDIHEDNDKDEIISQGVVRHSVKLCYNDTFHLLLYIKYYATNNYYCI